ncbi:MAG: DUF2752 domain-containing protein [Clostridia bacterium]|nr:DUF2752 domain-containing protein [Clostridia bacterium]
MESKASRVRFLIGQGILALFLAAFPLYRWWASVAPAPFGGCLLHDLLRLYCPACGGTRALSALLRLEVVEALRYHAYLVVFCVVGVIAETVAWVRFLGKREPILRLPKWVWILCAVLLLLFFLGRNVLLVCFGIDPIGELSGFWTLLRT